MFEVRIEKNQSVNSVSKRPDFGKLLIREKDYYFYKKKIGSNK